MDDSAGVSGRFEPVGKRGVGGAKPSAAFEVVGRVGRRCIDRCMEREWVMQNGYGKWVIEGSVLWYWWSPAM